MSSLRFSNRFFHLQTPAFSLLPPQSFPLPSPTELGSVPVATLVSAAVWVWDTNLDTSHCPLLQDCFGTTLPRPTTSCAPARPWSNSCHQSPVPYTCPWETLKPQEYTLTARVPNSDCGPRSGHSLLSLACTAGSPVANPSSCAPACPGPTPITGLHYCMHTHGDTYSHMATRAPTATRIPTVSTSTYYWPWPWLLCICLHPAPTTIWAEMSPHGQIYAYHQCWPPLMPCPDNWRPC